MANSVDPDQTVPSVEVWSGSALFAYDILSEILVYEILGHLPYIVNYNVKLKRNQINIQSCKMHYRYKEI